MADRKKKPKKRLGFILLIFAGILLILGLWFHVATTIHPPIPDSFADTSLRVTQPAPDFYTLGSNWLKKSNSGLWEMYLQGKPFERGVANGKLSKNLIAAQENAFIRRIREMIPSDNYLRFLKYFIYWFNRDLDKFIPEEYKLEIYGISLSALSLIHI